VLHEYTLFGYSVVTAYRTVYGMYLYDVI